MRAHVDIIEKKLQEKLHRTSDHPVRIRELIAYQVNNPNADFDFSPNGEFDPTTVISARFDAAKAATETEGEVIVRMAAYIKELANIAKKIHLQNNFKHPKNFIAPAQLQAMAAAAVAEKVTTQSESLTPEEQEQQDAQALYEQTQAIVSDHAPLATMDPKRQNNITRLSLHEFSLYPLKERGPLSPKGFEALMKRVQEIASHCPNNLHLLLSTVPVKSKNNDVFNMGMYVQCGAEPIIHSFAKALTSSSDPIYPQTQNTNFSSNIGSQALSFPIETQGMVLAEKLEKNTATISEVKNYRVLVRANLCKLNLSLKKNNDTDSIHTRLPHLLSLIHDNLEGDVYKISPSGPLLLEQHVQSLQIEAKNVFNKWITIAFQAILSRLPAATLQGKLKTEDVKPQGMNVAYGGIIHAFTAGGQSFSTCVDICLDHYYDIAKTAFKRETRNTSPALPTRASYLVTSNILYFTQNYFFAKSIVHADPLAAKHQASILEITSPGISFEYKPCQSIDIPNPYFGSHTIVDNYPAHELSAYLGEIATSLEERNQFMIRLQAFHIYRELHPENAAYIDSVINAYIIQPLLTIIGTNLSYENALTEINQLNTLFADYSDREKILDVLHDFKAQFPHKYRVTLWLFNQLNSLVDLIEIRLRKEPTQIHQRDLARNSADIQREFSAIKDLDQEDQRGYTPTLAAIADHDVVAMQRLHRDGVDFNRPATNGDAPIHVAVKMGRLDLIKPLVQDYYVNINAMDAEGKTPTHIAIEKGDCNFILELAKQGADFIQKLLPTQSSPLGYAATYRPEMLSAMLMITTSEKIDEMDVEEKREILQRHHNFLAIEAIRFISSAPFGSEDRKNRYHSVINQRYALGKILATPVGSDNPAHSFSGMDTVLTVIQNTFQHQFIKPAPAYFSSLAYYNDDEGEEASKTEIDAASPFGDQPLAQKSPSAPNVEEPTPNEDSHVRLFGRRR